MIPDDEKQDLKRRQQAGEAVEKGMIEYLVQYGPGSMSLGEVKAIAGHARNLSFDLFSKPGEHAF